MKYKLFLAIIPLVFAFRIAAQSFGSIGTEWYYSEHAGGLSGAYNGEFVHYKSMLDTTILGVTTHKITQEYFKFNGKMDNLESVYVYQKADTVFMFSFKKEKFLKLYIFNGDKGDTLTLDNLNDFSGSKPTYRLLIDTVINLKIDGIPVKLYKTRNLNSFMPYSFMDRIGGNNWFFPYGTAITIPEAGGPIRCYKDAEIDTNFQKINCDRSIFSIKKISKPYVIELFPNPVKQTLTIESTETIEKLELYDMTGKLIKTATTILLDFSDLGDGFYITKIYMRSGSTFQRKIIKFSL